MLIDTHAHLTDHKFDGYREDLISNLTQNNVGKVFIVAYDKQSIKDVLELSYKHDNLYCIIGVHPEEHETFDQECIDLILNNANNPKVVGIGEIGLDYHYDSPNKAEQKRIFIEQLKLANTLKLPISIHNRDSISDMLEILKENKDLLTQGGVFHCFSESVEVYKEIHKLGLKIAFGGTLTFKNAVNAPKVCQMADMSDILLETDCPYLAPTPHRGELNEPKYVSLVAEKIAVLRGISYDKVVEITTENALNLFTKAR